MTYKITKNDYDVLSKKLGSIATIMTLALAIGAHVANADPITVSDHQLQVIIVESESIR